MSTPLFLGIDIGTSGCRAVAIDEANTLVAQHSLSLPAPIQQGKSIEQDAEIWWQAVVQVLTRLFTDIDPGRIKAIAIDATSGTVLLCDRDGQPLHPALMYNDARAENEAARIREAAPIEAAATTSASSGLAKLLWLQKQGFSGHAHYFLHQADWITGKLSGHFGVSDFNNSLKSGYEAQNQCWPDWLDALAVKRNWLPEVCPPGSPLTPVSADMAQHFALNKDCLMVAGSTDSTAAFLAAGARQPGEAVTALGSTLVLKIISQTPVAAAEYGIYSQPLPNLHSGDESSHHWLCGGASNSGGTVLRQYFTDAQMAEMQTRLDPEQPTGLDYYPLPHRGERFPVNDPDLAPCLTPRPEDDVQFFQGMLEALARIEKTGYDKLQQVGAPTPTRIHSSGGGSQNLAWRKIREQLLQIPVLTATQTEAAYGAALLAKRGWHNKVDNLTEQ
ncbi:Carbohydrate kinase, FGGY family [hydrothermal vent metagenome]|uniref:Carbohydrate kinase, FGGY family n=1 Tax=hydrothermal vent metagenome TaxID=652676 RepID=A0A3B1BQ57_9ZZZZ